MSEVEEPAADSVEPEEDRAETLEFAKEDALDFLEGLLEAMDLDGEVKVELVGEQVEADVTGADLGILIGRYGRTLDAIQELLRAAVQHQAGGRVLVLLDIEGYRQHRREEVEELTRGMAEEALEQGEVRMEPMPAFERKVVHDTVGDIEGITSHSEGEDPDRYVVLTRTVDATD